jgi:cytochrome c6
MDFVKLDIKKIATAVLLGGALALGFTTNNPAGNLLTTPALGAVDAASVFKSKCAACHGADGGGNTPAGKSLKVRDLRSADVRGQGDAALLSIISNGKNKMPGYGKSLGADTCQQLVAYIKSLP